MVELKQLQENPEYSIGADGNLYHLGVMVKDRRVWRQGGGYLVCSFKSNVDE